jgi:hypothetical protein
MNDAKKARQWTEFLAGRKEIPASHRLLRHFDAGVITRICDCGCNSYDISVPKDSGLEPLLLARGRGGCAGTLGFRLGNREGSIEFDIFVDDRGYLAGVDVSFNANSEAMPDSPQILEPPYQVNGPLTP